MSVAPAALNSSFRGFLRPGTGFPFSFDDPSLGFDYATWDANDTESGQVLDDFLQQVVAGITGLDQTLVRPRWQPEPPNIPADSVAELGLAGAPCWCAVGVNGTTKPLGYAYNLEMSQGLGGIAASGYQRQSDWEEFEVLCSFYGELADKYAVLLRAGLMVAQNREVLQINNIGFVNTGGRTRVPRLVRDRWLWRVDLPITFTREVRHVYPVLYFLKSETVLKIDSGFENTTVTP